MNPSSIPTTPSHRGTLPFFLALLLALGATSPRGAQAADAHQLIEQKRQVAAFSAIELHGPYRVIVEAQGQRALQLSGEAERLADVETVVTGDTLVVRPLSRVRFVFGLTKANDQITVHINAPGLKQLKSAGSGSVQLSKLDNVPLELAMSGSADLSASGAVSVLTFRSSGSGDADLHLLKLASLEAKMSGSGDVDLAEVSQDLSAELSGSGDLHVATVRTARADLQMRGSGNVRLDGSSKDLRAELFGSGDLEGKGLEVERAVTRSRGSGDVHLRKVKQSLDAELRGSGEVNAGLAAQRAQVSINGSGQVELSGSVETLNAELNGSGELHARDLMAGVAEVKVRGSGEALVNVRAKPNGSGSMTSRLVRIDRSGAQQTQ